MTIEGSPNVLDQPLLGEAAAIEGSGMGRAVLDEGAVALKGMQAGSREWLGWAQAAYEANVGAWQALAGCRGTLAAMAVHSRLMQDHLKLLMDHGGRMTAWTTAPRNAKG
jgi:hypothetical protein